VRFVHRWAAHAITDGTPDGDTPAVGAQREALVTGYVAAATHLLTVLRATPEDAPAWAFGPEKVTAFWRRRQVHEVTMHLYDALASQGRATEWTIGAELGWDGVEEVATLFYPRQMRLGRTEPLAGTVRLVATDLEDRALILGEGEPVGEVRAPAADLLLILWKRLPVADATARELLSGTAVTP
jgi:uncharacterized protein (TIGR03083 family)